MRAGPWLLVPLLWLNSCGPPPETAPVPGKTTEVPHSWVPDRADPVLDAIQLWRRGADYVQGSYPDDESRQGILGPERDVVEGPEILGCAARRFLEDPSLKPAVHFGCCGSGHPFEDRLESDLKEAPGVFKLPALVLLMRVHAPASVDLQWRALEELRQLREPGARTLLDELGAQFSEGTLLRALTASPPEDRYREDPILDWNARAAGVVRLRRALPALVMLSRGNNLSASLAAERSLEDFEGREGEEALARCVLGWQYDAYVRAGYALLGRNPPLLVETLKAGVVPERNRYWQGLLLARADDPEAVPILCETIPGVGIVDREMFDQIERLAREGDLALVHRLSGRVRGEQQARASALVESLTRKFSRR